MSSPTINFHGVQVPTIGFGAMGLSAMLYGSPNDDESKKTLRKAIEIGCTFWDTSDIYSFGENEALIGSILKERDNRSKIFVVTKFGMVRGTNEKSLATSGVDCSRKHALEAIDASIERLGSPPDAWAAHRIDKNVPIEETVQAMEDVRKAGKCKFIGLSECSATTLRRACKVAKIHFIEVEYSPWTLVMEENQVLAAAKELGVIVLAYSPLGRGFLTGRFKSLDDFEPRDVRRKLPRFQPEVFEKNLELVKLFETLAEKKGCTSGQLALAWIVAQGTIIPIPGTTSEARLVENFASREVVLSPSEVGEVRRLVESHKPEGERYYAPGMALLDE